MAVIITPEGGMTIGDPFEQRGYPKKKPTPSRGGGGGSSGGGSSSGGGMSVDDKARLEAEAKLNEQRRVREQEAIRQAAIQQAAQQAEVQQQIQQQKIQPVEEKQELTREEKDVLVQERLDRLRGFSSGFSPKKEDFVYRNEQGKFNVWGTIGRSFVTTGDILTATTRADKLLSKSKILSTPISTAKAEQAASDVAVFTFFNPALATTAQTTKIAQSANSEVILGKGTYGGAKQTYLTQTSKGNVQVTTGAFKATKGTTTTRGLVGGISQKVSQSGKLTLSEGVGTVIPSRTGVNTLGKVAIKQSGKIIRGQEASLSFGAGKRFGQISFGTSEGSKFVGFTKGQVSGQFTNFQGKVFSLKGTADVLGSIKNVAVKQPSVVYEIVKPSAKTLMPLSKSGQVAFGGGINILPKFQGSIPTMQGTIGTQFASWTSSFSLSSTFLGGASIIKPREETMSVTRLAPKILQAPRILQPNPPKEKQIARIDIKQSSGSSTRTQPRQAPRPKFAVPTITIPKQKSRSTTRMITPRVPVTTTRFPTLVPFGLPTLTGRTRTTSLFGRRRKRKAPRRQPSLFALGRGIKATTRGRGERSGLTIRPIIIKKKKKKKGGKKK